MVVRFRERIVNIRTNSSEPHLYMNVRPTGTRVRADIVNSRCCRWRMTSSSALFGHRSRACISGSPSYRCSRHRCKCSPARGIRFRASNEGTPDVRGSRPIYTPFHPNSHLFREDNESQSRLPALAIAAIRPGSNGNPESSIYVIKCSFPGIAMILYMTRNNDL